MSAERVGDVVLAVGDDGVLEATIDRPEVRNALSPSVLEGLAAAVARAERDSHPVLIIRGRGGTLSAGADLGHLLAIEQDPAALEGYVTGIGAINTAIENARSIAIAVVDGYAVAGGLELLLACDLSIVTDRSQIGDRHLEYGLLPGAGGSVRLPRAIPGPLARRLMATGEMIDGATAHSWGLVSYAVTQPDLDATLTAIRARLARHSAAALAGIKKMYRAGVGGAQDAALARELQLFIEHMRSPAVAAGLRAFRDRQQPTFSESETPR